jgi:hypothetical protein
MRALLLLVALGLPADSPPKSPRLLQIHREWLRPGLENAYDEVERDTAKKCAELDCPHAYLALEALTGAKEVWFFNGYDSWADQQQVADAYAKKRPLLDALLANSKKKEPLTREPINVFAQLQPALTRGAPWLLGRGRFLVVSANRPLPKKLATATVFETPDGTTRFVMTPARTRAEADAAAAAAGPESRVFAVRPEWSFPAKEWTELDPELWSAARSER